MKALRWHARDDIRYEEIPEPSAGAGQLKVKISLAGICGTDLNEYANGPVMIATDKAPITLGHEFVGEVAALGEGVTDFRIGDRVTGLCNCYCGDCFFCKRGMYNICLNSAFIGLTINGCMADYMAAPSNTFYKLPDSITDEDAVLVEPLSVALHAVKLGRIKPGDTVAVVGDGTIGLCSLLAARAAGASAVYVVSKHKSRGDKALAMGANEVIYFGDGTQTEKIISLTGGLGVDVAIECTGRPETPQLAVDILRRNGIAVIVGVFEQPSAFHFASLVFNQITAIGSPIYVDEASTVIDLMADKRIIASGLITSKIPLKDAANMGFEELTKNKRENLKILLQIN